MTGLLNDCEMTRKHAPSWPMCGYTSLACHTCLQNALEKGPNTLPSLTPFGKQRA